MAASIMSIKGQTTVPKEIRDHLGIKPGDRLRYIVAADGSVRLEAQTLDARDLKGSLAGAFDRKLTVEAMRSAIRRRAGRGRSGWIRMCCANWCGCWSRRGG